MEGQNCEIIEKQRRIEAMIASSKTDLHDDVSSVTWPKDNGDLISWLNDEALDKSKVVSFPSFIFFNQS
jgi:hypothetical protein